MTSSGASSSLRLNPAKVSFVNPQPAFSFGGENAPDAPFQSFAKPNTMGQSGWKVGIRSRIGD
jgi:hypothetical protein